jgi:hypothetical protein
MATRWWLQAKIVSIPTPIIKFYQVRLTQSQEIVSCDCTDIIDPDTAIGTDDHFHLPTGMLGPDDDNPFSPTNPEWMQIGSKVSLFVNDKTYKGKLDLDDDNDWICIHRTRPGWPDSLGTRAL